MTQAKNKALKKKPALKSALKLASKPAAKKQVAKTSAPQKPSKKTAAKKLAVKKTAKPAKPAAKTAVSLKTALKKLVAKKPAVKPRTAKPLKKPAGKKAAPKNVVTPAAQPILTPFVNSDSRHGVPEQLLEAALKVLDERQAEEIFTVDLTGKSSMADYLIIASGRAARQIGAIAQYLRDEFEKLGVKKIRVEGLTEGNWVLVDAGDVIIHLFRPEVRRYYNLESIWDGSNVDRAAVTALPIA